MKEANVTPNVITYTALINACGKGGQWEEALKLLDAMEEDKVTPDTITYNALINACEQRGQWKQAFKVTIAWFGPS
jgi:pentatricopeptide repeat domain-containing protein 1